MKICILRRDGENVHNGMAEVMLAITERYFGRKELFLDKNKIYNCCIRSKSAICCENFEVKAKKKTLT